MQYRGSRAKYNGIEFRNVLVESIDQNVVMDASNTDPVTIDVAFTFKGIVHLLDGSSHLSGGMATGEHTIGYRFAPGDSSSTPKLADAINDLSFELNMPRKRFEFWIGEDKCFDIQPIQTEDPNYDGLSEAAGLLKGLDVSNGPRATATIGKIINNHSAHARITVRFSVAACKAGDQSSSYSDFGGQGGRVLHMRYWSAEDIDGSSWLRSRIWQGKVRVASQKVSGLALRYAIMPPLIRGYKRESFSINESPSGLEIDFRCTDKQINAQPPAPASDWHGYHMVSTPYIGGALADESVYVKLTGPPNVDKISLLGLAVQIIDAKVHYLDRINDDSLVLQHASFKDDFRDNTIEAQARFKLVGKIAGSESLYNIPSFEFGLPLNLPGYDPTTATYEYPPDAGFKDLFVCRLQTPCKPAIMATAFDLDYGGIKPQAPLGADTGQTGKAPGTANNYPPTEYSPPHRSQIYTHYAIDSDYYVSSGRAVLARAFQDQGGASGPDDETPITNRASNLVFPLFAKQAIREVRIEGERLNTWPALPREMDFTDHNGIEHRVLEYKILGQGTELSADGLKSIHRTSIEIRYIMSRAPTLEDTLTTGILPYRTATSPVQYSIDAPAFVEPWALLGGTGTPL